MRKDAIRRFWGKVKVLGEGECWEWQAGKIRRGYGSFEIDGKTKLAHRVAWSLAHEQEVPDGAFVCHKCDNPSCVNPDHLFLGDAKTNLEDCVAKGRTARGMRHGAYTHPERRPRGDRSGSRTKPESRPRGERNAQARLTAEQVREIRRRYAEGGVSHRQLARENSVTQRTISNIVRGEIWRHLL